MYGVKNLAYNTDSISEAKIQIYLCREKDATLSLETLSENTDLNTEILRIRFYTELRTSVLYLVKIIEPFDYLWWYRI